METSSSLLATVIRAVIVACLVLPTAVFAIDCTPNFTSGNCRRERFANLGVVVDRISVIGPDRCYWDGGPTLDPAAPLAAYNLPLGSCVLIARSPTEDWRFALILPPAHEYKRRFFATGNGGFNGGINWPELSFAPHYGAAVVGTDTGHNSSDVQEGMQWVLNATKRTNWAYQAMDGAVHFGKILTNAYYGSWRSIERSYYSGCSTGGRQGLKYIQRHANDMDKMDGVIIGAPAWNLKEMLPYLMSTGIANLRREPDGTITNQSVLARTEWAALTASAFKLCDGKTDGHGTGNYNPDGDRVISIDDCFDGDDAAYSKSLKKVAPDLTDEQRAAAVAIYKGLVVQVGDVNKTVFPGPQPGGEADWVLSLGPGIETTFDQGLAEYWLAGARGNKKWHVDYWDREYLDGLTGKQWVYRESTRPGSPLSDATADDFAAMAKYRGKLLLFHGIADGLIPVASSNRLYKEITKIRSEGDWFRYFQIPGMHHCTWSPEFSEKVKVDTSSPPWYIGTATQLLTLLFQYNYGVGYGIPKHIPPNDAPYDAIQTMIDWVENPFSWPPKTPSSLIATSFAPYCYRTRKLCPYPQRAALTGWPPEHSSSWTCLPGKYEKFFSPSLQRQIPLHAGSLGSHSHPLPQDGCLSNSNSRQKGFN